MKLIGNFANWITPELWNILETTDGMTVPVWQPDRWQGNEMLNAARKLAETGYAHRNHNFQMFNSSTAEMQNIKLEMPIPITRKRYNWWFVKYHPGQMQPMHYDPELTELEDPESALRYTMMLTNYQPGHIYVYDDQLLTGYKRGDMFLWPNSMLYHGAVNISYEPRYTFQLTMYN